MEASSDRLDDDGKRRSRFTAANIALVGFMAIAAFYLAAFYLIAEHRAHLLSWLPWLIILACPLLHIFMHGRHGGHGDGRITSETSETISLPDNELRSEIGRPATSLHRV